jgi:DNA-binding beta-propeller fold protein YncE
MAISQGQTIGQYVIKKKIGEGGMGSVYLAEQPAVSREVVVKVLASDFAATPGAVDRFKREADMIARLEHPHILPVYDFGEVGGSLYLVMRYMRGGSLADRLESRSLTRDQLLAYLDQIAQALDFAHARGVIHRDLKPANILLDELGNAYLADFGLAKSVEGTRDLTATGSILGTPAYMSPEQARGEKLGARSDVYSFALLLYRGLAGRLPFDAGDPWALIQKVLTEDPPSILDYAPRLPAGVDDALRDAMAKDPERRPGRATEVLKSVRMALEGTASAVPPAVPSGRASAAASRAASSGRAAVSVPAARPRAGMRWAIAGIGLLVVGAVIVGGGLLAYSILTRGAALAPRASVYPAGDSPRSIIFEGDSIWVADFFDNAITRVTATGCDASPDPCGKPIGTYPVDTAPVALASDGAWLWVASAANSTLTQMSLDTGQEQARFKLAHVPSSMIYADGSLWTSNGFVGTVTKISTGGEILGDYTVGTRPYGMAFDGSSLWVALQEDRAVVQIDPDDGHVVSTIPLDGQAYAVAYDGRHIWAALGDGNQVVEIDPSNGSIVARVQVGDRPSSLVFDGIWLWSADLGSKSASRIDVTTAERTSSIGLEGAPYALAWAPCGEGCGDLWTANEAEDTLSRVRIK